MWLTVILTMVAGYSILRIYLRKTAIVYSGVFRKCSNAAYGHKTRSGRDPPDAPHVAA